MASKTEKSKNQWKNQDHDRKNHSEMEKTRKRIKTQGQDARQLKTPVTRPGNRWEKSNISSKTNYATKAPKDLGKLIKWKPYAFKTRRVQTNKNLDETQGRLTKLLSLASDELERSTKGKEEYKTKALSAKRNHF